MHFGSLCYKFRRESEGGWEKGNSPSSNPKFSEKTHNKTEIQGDGRSDPPPFYNDIPDSCLQVEKNITLTYLLYLRPCRPVREL